MTTVRVIGIDPGSRITGFGVVEKNGRGIKHIDNGCIVTTERLPLPQRIEQIYRGLQQALEKFRPDVLAVERVFVAKNAASSLKLGEARGVVLLAAVQRGLPIYEYTPLSIKQAVTGYGQAGKEQVQKMVMRLLSLREVAAEDASDALAVAICHLHTTPLSRMTA